MPTAWIDTETTGVCPGIDRAVQVGLARFEGGKLVGSGVQRVNPGIPIPPQATAIHGITDAMVVDMPTIENVFAGEPATVLLTGAQPSGYNANFDRHFVPPFGDWAWPWLDALSLVRVVDRFERGKGRHRLEAACARHGVKLSKAHDAEADAIAAGELFYALMPKLSDVLRNQTRGPEFPDVTMGALLCWQKEQEAAEWFRFNEWLARQPPRDEART